MLSILIGTVTEGNEKDFKRSQNLVNTIGVPAQHEN